MNVCVYGMSERVGVKMGHDGERIVLKSLNNSQVIVKFNRQTQESQTNPLSTKAQLHILTKNLRAS